MKDFFVGMGRFLHLIEDGVIKISMSGVQLWLSTFVSVETLFTSHDPSQLYAAGAVNIAAMGGHAIKRSQILNSQEAAPEGVVEKG